jgi:hypothetical protein
LRGRRNGGTLLLLAWHSKQGREVAVRLRFAVGILLLLVPMTASAEGTVQPKYPPAFDCSAVAAGSQRQACNRSHLAPPMGSIEQPKRQRPDSPVRQPDVQPLPMGKPPTVPPLPGTIQNSN